METLATVAFTVLFVVAIAAKLDGWAAWSAAVREWFGSSRAADVAQRLIPACECAAIVTLVISPASGLLFSGLLLLAFGVGAGYLAGRGVQSSCACFGAASPSRISFRLAARNLGAGLLAGIAGVFSHVKHSQPVALVAISLLVSVGVMLAQESRALTQRHEQPIEEGHR